jgi:hypothetical protein
LGEIISICQRVVQTAHKNEKGGDFDVSRVTISAPELLFCRSLLERFNSLRSTIPQFYDQLTGEERAAGQKLLDRFNKISPQPYFYRSPEDLRTFSLLPGPRHTAFVTYDDIREHHPRAAGMSEEEFDDMMSKSAYQCLLRGFAYHYADAEKSYRRCVESLFRAKKLTFVIATSTLATGINMPCRTVIIAGSGHYLTTMMINQMMGRAGRRGIDKRGHVVLFSFSRFTANFYLRGFVPHITGHAITTVTETGRLISEFCASDDIIRKSFFQDQLLRPFFHLPFDPHQRKDLNCFFALFHADFLLQHIRALSNTGKQDCPVKGNSLMYLINHLFFLDPSNIFLASLIFQGAFDDLAQEYYTAIQVGKPYSSPQSAKEALELQRVKILTILAFLLHRSEGEELTSESALIDPPPVILDALKALNDRYFASFRRYIGFFAERTHSQSYRVRSTLEQSFIVARNEDRANQDLVLNAVAQHSRPYCIRAPYFAISGKGDDFASAVDLVGDTPTHLQLSPRQVPSLNLNAKVNSYIVKFYQHRDKTRLKKENGIRSSQVFDLFKRFGHSIKVVREALGRRIGFEFLARKLKNHPAMEQEPCFSTLPQDLKDKVKQSMPPQKDPAQELNIAAFMVSLLSFCAGV